MTRKAMSRKGVPCHVKTWRSLSAGIEAALFASENYHKMIFCGEGAHCPPVIMSL